MRNWIIIGLCAILLILPLAGGCGAKPASGGASSAKPSASASASAEQSAKATASAAAAPSASAPAVAPTPTPAGVSVGTVVDGWVAGIPDYVPRFAYGALDKSRSKITQGSISTAFVLCFTGVAQGDVDAYAALLQQKGYKAVAAQIGDLYTLTASLEFSYGIVTVVVTLDAGGTASYALEAPV